MTLSNKLSRPSSPNPEEKIEFEQINRDTLAELLTFIDFTEGFTIGFVEINFPPDADILEEYLKEHAAALAIQLVPISISDPQLRFLKDEILKYLASVQHETDKKLVLLLRGLDKSIGLEGDYPPVLQDLNFVRDAYKYSVPYPILFILPDYALTRLARFAPDFWAWKSGVFHFRMSPISRVSTFNTIQAQAFEIDRMPMEEKQEHIDTLHRMLMEFKPSHHRSGLENSPICANLLLQLGAAYLSKRDFEKSREYLEKSLDLSSKINDVALIAKIRQQLGHLYSEQRMFEQSIEFYEKALEIFQEIDDTNSEVASLFNLGNIYLNMRNFVQAESYYKRCLRIEQLYDWRYSQASTYHQLGIVAQEQREYAQAKEYYQQALDIKIEFNDRYSQARTYHQLGIVAEEQREYAQARQYYQQALDIFIEFNDRYRQASTYHQLGRVAEEQREYAQAKEFFLQALQIFTEYQDEHNGGIVLRSLARLDQTTEDERLITQIAEITDMTVERVKEIFEQVKDS